jgi:hypothetical protein
MSQAFKKHITNESSQETPPPSESIIDEDGYKGYHISWTQKKGTGGPTKSRPTRPEGTGYGAHNRGSLEDNYRIKSCKYGK